MTAGEKGRLPPKRDTVATASPRWRAIVHAVRWALPAFPAALLAAPFAPGFLFAEDPPRRADAVVLFVGPENRDRLREAERLLAEGRAPWLLIPAWGEMYRADAGGRAVKVSGDRERGRLLFRVRKHADGLEHYENTHLEALEARRMLDRIGARTALLVSSGYHTRRIGMIAGRVFPGDLYGVALRPVRGDEPFSARDWFHPRQRRIIAGEYLKMAWFLLYGWTGRSTQ